VWVCEHDTLGYTVQGLSPQLQHWRTLFLVCDTEGRPSFCQASTYVSTTRTADDDDVPCPCVIDSSITFIFNIRLQDLFLHFRFGDNIGIQSEIREQIVRKSSCDRHRRCAVRSLATGGRDYDFETSGGTQD